MKVKDKAAPLFGTDTGETLPESYLYSHKAWDAYMGDLWASLLRFMNIDKDGDVIEVAPGASVKIAMALSITGFRGRLYVVDPASDVVAGIQESYTQLLPDAQILFIDSNLDQSLDRLPRHSACLLSNHPLDDMILARGAAPTELNEIFGWGRRDEDSFSPLAKKTWDKIEKNPVQLASLKNSVITEWTDSLNTLKPRWIAISQYKSSVLQQSSLAGLNHHATALLEVLRAQYQSSNIDSRRLQPLFNTHKNYNNAHIGDQILDAAHWLVLEKG